METAQNVRGIGFAAKSPLVDKAHEIGSQVAAVHAIDVDRKARFPQEAIDAMRKAKLMSAFVPRDLGGQGASISDMAGVCHALGRYCASSAMIYAMHQIQVACIVRHRRESDAFRKYLIEISERELLLASATTELGPSGNTRMSSCAIERDGERFKLEKNAPVISYGEHCDAILVTSRRAPDAPTSDQVLSLVKKGEFTLDRTSTWDTLGMRGTCSNGFMLKCGAPADQILPTPFADISAQTMLPFSHVVWSSLWLGIATEAVDRARAFVRGAARKTPGVTPPGALRLAETMNTLTTMRANVQDAIRDYEHVKDDPEALSALGFAIRMNNLKIGTTELAVQVVGQALGVVGIMGYKEDSKMSVARHLRDVHGGALMVSNDRIYGTNAQLLCVYKDD